MSTPKPPTKTSPRTGFLVPTPTTADTWTVKSMRVAMRAHQQGDFALSGALADFIRSDDRVFATLDSRTLGVLGLPFAVEAGTSKRRRKDAEGLAAEVGESWFELVPEQTLAEAMDWTHIMGFAIAEASWGYDESTDRQVVTDLWVHHPSFTMWSGTHQAFRVFTGVEWETVTPGDGRWIVFSKKRQRPWMAGALRALAVPTVLRGMVRVDWAGRAEFESTGIKKAKVPSEGTTEEEIRKFLAQVKALGARGVLRLPPGFDFDLARVDAAATQVFAQLVEHCEAAITLTLLGQNLTTQTEGGSYAAAGVHARVLLDRIKADVALLSTTLHNQLLKPWCLYNEARFESGIVPWPKWDPSPPEDVQKTSQAMLTLSQAVKGLREQNVDVTPLLEKYGLRPLAAGGSEKPPIFAYHLNAGVLTINEVRATLGLDPVPWGDERTSAAPLPPVSAPASPTETSP